MRFFGFFFLLMALAPVGSSQRPDVDDLGRELDLTPIATPAPGETPASAPSPSPTDLHAGRKSLATDPRPDVQTDVPSGLLFVRLPAGPHLVVPNPARLDKAWPLLREATLRAELKINGPLYVVLHADGNVSAAVPVLRDEPKPLPFGADISPQEELRLVGVWAELPEARRNHPALLAAFQELRAQLTAAGKNPDPREFYFFPTEEGRVFFALRLRE